MQFQGTKFATNKICDLEYPFSYVPRIFLCAKTSAVSRRWLQSTAMLYHRRWSVILRPIIFQGFGVLNWTALYITYIWPYVFSVLNCPEFELHRFLVRNYCQVVCSLYLFFIFAFFDTGDPVGSPLHRIMRQISLIPSELLFLCSTTHDSVSTALKNFCFPRASI
jgi:hypothetical protein